MNIKEVAKYIRDCYPDSYISLNEYGSKFNPVTMKNYMSIAYIFLYMSI
jgi:hypothetical protein